MARRGPWVSDEEFARRYTEPAWIKRKQMYYSRQRYECRACRACRGLQLHHRTYGFRWAHEPDFALNYFCQSCHDKVTRLTRRGWNRWLATYWVIWTTR